MRIQPVAAPLPGSRSKHRSAIHRWMRARASIGAARLALRAATLATVAASAIAILGGPTALLADNIQELVAAHGSRGRPGPGGPARERHDTLAACCAGPVAGERRPRHARLGPVAPSGRRCPVRPGCGDRRRRDRAGHLRRPGARPRDRCRHRRPDPVPDRGRARRIDSGPRPRGRPHRADRPGGARRDGRRVCVRADRTTYPAGLGRSVDPALGRCIHRCLLVDVVRRRRCANNRRAVRLHVQRRSPADRLWRDDLEHARVVQPEVRAARADARNGDPGGRDPRQPGHGGDLPRRRRSRSRRRCRRGRDRDRGRSAGASLRARGSGARGRAPSGGRPRRRDQRAGCDPVLRCNA